MALSENAGQKRFRFYLQNASKGHQLLRYTPSGWDDAKFELKRNQAYHGLFRSITFNQLVFVKDARNFIRDVYELEGINALITFTVQRLNHATQAYESYFTGKLDLSTYKIEETGVTCQVVDTQLAEKVKNRETVKVNLRKRKSIEGYEIPAFTDEDPTLQMPDYEIEARATWGDRLQMTSALDNHFVPLWEGVSEFTETEHQDCTEDPDTGTPMFNDSTADRTLRLSITDISGTITFSSTLPHASFRLLLYKNNTAYQTLATFTSSNSNQLLFTYNGNIDFTIVTGEDFSLRGSLDHSGSTVYNSTIQVDISEVQVNVPGSGIIAYPYYEALLRLIQIITDSNDCFYSNKFGRTDTEIMQYPVDGQLGHLTKGIFVRNAEGFNNSIAINLQETFKSLSSLFCLGMGIETIKDVDRVVVEELSYFYSSDVVVDLSARIREDAIGKEVMPEKHYNKIAVGYNSFEYSTAGGLAEYNTKSEFSTVISAVDNGLDLISKYRADTQGIVILMKEFSEGEDVKGDEDIFIIDSVRRTTPYTGYIARTNEDFTLVTGGADAENSFNLDYTPKRNLLRNGLLIRAGLGKNLGTYIRWQSGDKNTTLATQKTGEVDPLVENADVLVNDLTEPFFLPEQYTLECEMDYDDLTAILANPKGLIKLSDTKYGWILDLSIGNKENKADLRLLRANLNMITPNEMT